MNFSNSCVYTAISNLFYLVCNPVLMLILSLYVKFKKCIFFYCCQDQFENETRMSFIVTLLWPLTVMIGRVEGMSAGPWLPPPIRNCSCYLSSVHRNGGQRKLTQELYIFLTSNKVLRAGLNNTTLILCLLCSLTRSFCTALKWCAWLSLTDLAIIIVKGISSHCLLFPVVLKWKKLSCRMLK